MKQEDIDRLKELRTKDRLTEKEEAEWLFLEKKAENDERVTQFRKNQKEPYASKRSRAVNLAWEFYKNVEVDGNCYVAVGGLDSIVLYLFLRSIGIDVPAVSVSSLEDKSIQKVHKALGVIALKSATDGDGKPYSKVKVIRDFGWPVISKEVAGKISLLQHPTEENATVRHAIITGETGAQGGYRTGSKMQLRKCKSDNVAYVHYNGRGGAKWRVQCFDCGHTVDKGNKVRHDAQINWNEAVRV